MNLCYKGSSSRHDDQPGMEHEVFLSFRGEDTRTGFTDHLYHSLDSARVRVFRDNEKLHVGEEIGPQLMKGIKESKISIPIFSENYAASKWCLREFALMMKCRKTMNQIVLPIFYSVTPNEVQHQTGKFKEAFAKHEKECNAETVQEWKNALSEVASLKGWEKKKMFNGHEAKLVELVVAEVRRMLNKGHIVLPDSVVGLDEQAYAVMDLLEVSATDVRIVAIWGMGGIGKTTLANVIYNHILDEFECCGFLENIREKASQHNGLEFLQSILVAQLSRAERRDFNSISDGIKELKDRFRGKKVLILLDDVDHDRQLDALGAGVDWFGRGSRIIITTRDRGILTKCTDKIYDVKEMKDDQAFRLFSQHAFKADSPPDQLMKISEDIVKLTGGLPLALEVIGGLLAGKRREIWEAVLEKLEKIPNDKVEEKLRVSYEALTSEQKYMFLDIACFHIGEDMRVASYMWKDYFGFSPAYDIDILCSRSLIKIRYGNELWMHDQLRDLGRAIVEKENNNPGRERIWLWRSNNAREFLNTRKLLMEQESSRVEVICLDRDDNDFNLTDRQCEQLPNLRYMRLNSINLIGDFQHCLSKLKWLSISSLKSGTVSKLSLKNLVVLNLSRSWIADWNWCSMQVAPQLKVLSLSYCWKLTRTPDFSLFPNLERLNLSHCDRLEVVHPSIGELKSLVYLNLKRSRGVEELPHQMTNLTSLVELDVSDTGIKDIPLPGNMRKLEILRASWCLQLKRVPDCIGDMISLRELAFDVCIDIRVIPESIGNLHNLERLNLTRTGIRCLPSGLWKLRKLRAIDALGFESFEREIPSDIGVGGLSHLEILKIKATDICSVPAAITSLSHLQTLHLDHPVWDDRPRISSHTPRLEALPELPISLISAVVTCKSVLPIPNLHHLTNLQELQFQSCVGMTQIPRDISKLTKLQKLCILGCPLLVEIQGLENLKLLRVFVALNCKKLHKLEGLDALERLQELKVSGCVAIERLPNLSKLRCLRILQTDGCEVLQDLEGLDCLEALKILNISSCEAIKRLPNLSNLKCLQTLYADSCDELQNLEGLHALEALESLDISSCKAIKRLPNLSNLKRLQTLYAGSCEELQDLEGLDGLEALEDLNISSCKVIKQLPNLANLKCLLQLEANGCEMLQDLKGLDGLEALVEIGILGCTALKSLPILSGQAQKD